ncbi:MAG: hypothetical protein WDW38_008406 [Sanguina aurantia]
MLARSAYLPWATVQPPADIDLSPLTFPNLRELRLINCAATRLVLGSWCRSYPIMMVLDMPWVEHFELQDVTVTGLELRAPRLMELQLIHCYSLESVALLPDGDPPAVDMFADAADAAVVVPVSCMPCAAGRVALVLCNNGAWRGSEGFTTLTEDPRIFRVDDQEYEQPDSEPADSVFDDDDDDDDGDE